MVGRAVAYPDAGAIIDSSGLSSNPSSEAISVMRDEIMLGASWISETGKRGIGNVLSGPDKELGRFKEAIAEEVSSLGMQGRHCHRRYIWNGRSLLMELRRRVQGARWLVVRSVPEGLSNVVLTWYFHEVVGNRNDLNQDGLQVERWRV